MQSAVMLLERNSVTPQQVWRDPALQRTLPPIDVTHLITAAWKSNQGVAIENGFITLALELDGSAKQNQPVRIVHGQQKIFSGVFEMIYMSQTEVKVTLREDECLRRLGSPKRATRQIALLRPWNVTRVLLNGRSASYSGQHYILCEYHLVLCRDPAPDWMGSARSIDLQEDLF